MDDLLIWFPKRTSGATAIEAIFDR